MQKGTLIHFSTLLKLFKEVGEPNTIIASGTKKAREMLEFPTITYFEDDKLIIRTIYMRGEIVEDRFEFEGKPCRQGFHNAIFLVLENGVFYTEDKAFKVVFLKDGVSYSEHFPRLLEIENEIHGEEMLEKFIEECDALFKECKNISPIIRNTDEKYLKEVRKISALKTELDWLLLEV